jgi:hypothetical protein
LGEAAKAFLIKQARETGQPGIRSCPFCPSCRQKRVAECEEWRLAAISSDAILTVISSSPTVVFMEKEAICAPCANTPDKPGLKNLPSAGRAAIILAKNSALTG